MAIRVRGLSAVARELEQSLERAVKDAADLVDERARANTPVRTGYTQKQWQKQTSKSNFQVKNTVPWIERLEQGSSKQAPRGIIGPTLKQVRRKL